MHTAFKYDDDTHLVVGVLVRLRQCAVVDERLEGVESRLAVLGLVLDDGVVLLTRGDLHGV